MIRSFPFALTFLLPILSSLALALRGPWLLGPPLFLFVLTPLLDAVLGKSTDDLEAERAAELWRDLRYDVWLWLWIPVQLGVLVGAIAVGAGGAPPWEIAGAMVASGLVGGFGINVAHELMHRKGRGERAAAEVLMTAVGYTHFCVEHVLGHHKNVATRNDGATSRRGESVFRFVVRSVCMGAASAWRLERARVQKLGVPAFSLRDRRLRYPLVILMLVVVVAVSAGLPGVLVFLGQSAVAILLLEVINYVEHYGLERRQLATGSYERVQPHHSWSSSHRLTNWFLFHLPRHADHHAHASRPFFALRHLDDGPQLPAGYATMLLVALVPPLWRAVMDPRVDAWHARGETTPARPRSAAVVA